MHGTAHFIRKGIVVIDQQVNAALLFGQCGAFHLQVLDQLFHLVGFADYLDGIGQVTQRLLAPIGCQAARYQRAPSRSSPHDRSVKSDFDWRLVV